MSEPSIGQACKMSSALPCAFSAGDVDHDDVGQLLDGDRLRGGRADVAGAPDDCDFPVHLRLPFENPPLTNGVEAPSLHVLDDGVGELRRLELGRAGHQPLEVVGHVFCGDGLLERGR